MISEKFLNNKIEAARSYWEKNNIHNEWSKGYIKDVIRGFELRETESGKLCFVLYNLLGNFSGHYKVIVDVDTFEYHIKKIGCFGGLLWMRESDDDTIYTKDNLSEEQRLEMEAHIANTIEMVYYGKNRIFRLDIEDKDFQLRIFGKIEQDF